MWETIIQSLLQAPEQPTLEQTRAALQSMGYDIYRTSWVDSLCNAAIQQQETLQDFRSTTIFLITFGVFLILSTIGMSYYYENTASGMKRVVDRYQKYLQKKGIPVQS